METDANTGFDGLPPLVPLAAASATSLIALQASAPALLGPVVPGSLTLIRGSRGMGKSWLALGMAQAIAAGVPFLGWPARAAPVLYVETAMSGALFAARLRAIGAAPGLRAICDVPLDLAGNDDQARLMDLLPEAGGVLVLDGLAPVTRGGRDAWAGFTAWLRMLRRSGHAVVLVDPAARPALAALADTLITAKRGDGAADLSLAVEIASRHKLAAADRAFRVDLAIADDRVQWRRATVVPAELRDVIEAARHGGTVRDIAARAGVATATAWRRLDRARALGLLEPGETSGTAPAPDFAVRPDARMPHETGGTDLAKVSTAVLKRTLARRKEVQGRAEQDRRPGPAILAGFPDAALAAECARRLKPEQAARLITEYAPAAA
jgi:hypothetical protein